MRRFSTLVLISLICLSVIAASLSLAARTMSDFATGYVQQPSSAIDMIMRSRQTPAEDGHRSNAAVFGAGLLALALLVFGGYMAYLYLGAGFFKQRRLDRKRSQGRPSLPYAPLREVSRVPQARQLPGYVEGEYDE
jgi:hypothetical protein